MVKTVRRFVWQLRCLLLVGVLAGQASAAHVSFEEGTLPPDVQGWTNVSVTVSDDHAKFGTNSLKVDWAGATEPKQVTLGPGFSNPTSKGSFWIYSKTKQPGATVRIELLDGAGAQVGYFDLNMEFSGWRGVFWKDTFFSTVPNGSSYNSMRFVFPDNAAANTVYIDGLFYVNTALDGSSSDYLIWQDLNFDGPGEPATDTHWNFYTDFKNNPVPTGEADYARAVTQAELDDLAAVKNEYELVPTAALSASSYSSALTTFNNWNISTNADGTVKGTALFFKNMGYGGDAPNNISSFQADFLKVVNAYVQAEAMGPANYAADLKEKAVQMARHGRDQLFSYGSANGGMTHYGYNVRDWCYGVFRLRHAIADAGWVSQAADDMGWFYVRNRIFEPSNGGSGDDMGTTMTGRLLSILVMPDADDAVRHMRYFSSKLTKYLTPAGQPSKPDGAWWHHGMMLPTYQPTHLGSGAPIVRNLQNTESFRVSEAAHQAFRTACLYFIWFGDGAWPMSLQGRSPGQTSGASTAKSLANYMAQAGTPDGSETVDREMAEQYARLNGGDAGDFADEGISAQPLEGTRTMPYGAWTGHRRDGWLVSVKGHSRYQAFGESFGVGKWRYMSHGTLEVMNSQSSSSYGIGDGWDWTRYPGTTVLRRGIESDVAGVAQIDYLSMDFQSYGSWAVGRRRFVGGLSHRDLNGCYVMQVEGAPGSNFYRMTADTDMVAKKGYFFFDDRVICLGNSISSQNSSYPMETTLIQNEWNSGEQVLLDGSPVSFPSSTTDKATLTTLLDQHNVGYYVAGGQDVNLALRRQKPQDGAERDMFQVWLDHGTEPSNAEYEYAVLPETTSGTLAQFSTDMQTPGSEPYVVRKNTGNAQIVWDRETDTTAYIIYPSVDSYSSGYNEAVSYTPFGAEDLLLDIDEAALVMAQPLSSQTLVMSVSDPNLGTDVSDVYAIDSPVNTKTLVVQGVWKFRETPAATTRIISQTAGSTTLEVDCQHGASQSFVLVDALGNNPPYRLENPPEYALDGGTTADFDLSQEFNDPESGVTFELLDGPAWVSLGTNGIMTVVAPVQVNTATFTNTVRVTDAGGLTLDADVVVEIQQDPVLIISPNAKTIRLASGESTSVDFDVLYGGGGSIYYGLSNNVSWLTNTAILVNGDFEQPAAAGWTFTDILSAGDHAYQGYYETGSWTADPAVSNAYYNLGRSSQLTQILPVTMSSGTTYRVAMSMRQVSSSYAKVQVAFTDAAGTDLAFGAGNNYSASLGSGNGETFSMNNTSGYAYEASFTAGSAEHGQTLGLRIASVRDYSPTSTDLLGIDDVTLSANLLAGDSFTHPLTVSAEGLANGTYHGIVTAYDLDSVVASTNMAVTLIVTDDRDDDGIPNDWELRYSGSTTGLLPHAHNDTDNISNLDEYILGYSPLVSNTPLLVHSIEIGPSVEVTFGATTNARHYTIEFAEDLTGGWTNVASGVAGSNGVTTISVANEGQESGAYRVKVFVP